MRMVLIWTGELQPWRRSFWRFAADRSILTRTDGEYRFIHILVRDHLAACDPAAVARSVQQRSAQLSRVAGSLTPS